MKKIASCFFAIIYFLTATGFVVNVHYCMGQLSSLCISLQHEEEGEDCSKCGMKHNQQNCCRTESQVLKINDSHQIAQIHYELNQPELTLNPFDKISFDLNKTFATSFGKRNYHPPPDSKHPLYIKNRVYRI